MWPVLLNMTRDECRLTLRRLELEAYSNMVNVFRAQGALEENRKKLLEELRAALHIGQERHSAEARRVSNDQLLATIAEQLSGPNTGIAWICEGRRRVPLLPRGIPQTAYTEIADKAAEAAAAENKEIQKRLAAEKLNASKINEEEMTDVEGYNQETSSNYNIDDSLYPPIAVEDQTAKLWETELVTRKRKQEGGGSDDAPPPFKNMRNIPINTNQKHLNLSQLYSKFSQPATSKAAGQSKHSYNQVSKVSTSKSTKTSKSGQPHAPRSTPHKPRVQRAPKTPRLTKAQKKAQAQAQEIHTSPGKYNAAMPLEYAGPPNTFQASYAQAVLGGKTKPDFLDEMKVTGGVGDSPTMQLLTRPASPRALPLADNSHPDEHAPPPPPVKQPAPVKPTHVVMQRGDLAPDKPAKSDVKIVQKPGDIKLLSNRQMVVAPNLAPKTPLNAPGKLVTTKVIGSIPKSRGVGEKMIVVSKPLEHKNPPSAKVIVTSSANTHTPGRERTFSGNNPAHRIPETFTPKGLPATDLKVSAKALVLNPKSGQKMVVVPASKARTKAEGKIPLIHFKGISTAMKLLPVGSQPQAAQSPKTATIQVLSKPPAQTKLMGPDTIPIKTANLADIIPVKGMTPSTPKITNPIMRPSSTKGNVIVVQKGTHIGKALAFAKNGNDMSKIIMGKNVTQLLQASKAEHADAAKAAGNVIVLELNNEHSGRPTTMSEILDGRAAPRPAITPDTPVLFAAGAEPAPAPAPAAAPEPDAKDSSSVTDWEMELDTVVETKDKDDDDDKLNSLHLDLGMSSDSDGEYMAAGRAAPARRAAPRPRPAVAGEGGEVYSSSSAMSVATRTLLSQLQDDGSSSNDSSFALRARGSRRRDRSESDDLTKAKEKLSEKVREARSQQRRIDIYSTAIAPSDINLDSFAYLEEGMLGGDDVFADDKRERRPDALDDQLSRLLGDDSANSNDSQPVSEHMPLAK